MAGLTQKTLFETFSQGVHSDFTIICQNREFKVHKMIICAESHFIRAVCNGDFMEQGSVELKEDDPEVVTRMIHYLYFGDYHNNPDMCTLETHSNPHYTSLSTWIKSIKLNSRVQILSQWRTLDDHEAALSAKVSHNLKIHYDTYRCADKFGIEPLKKLAAELFINAIKDRTGERVFTVAISLVYQNSTTADCVLRSTVTDYCMFNHHTIKGLPQAHKLMEEYEPAAWRVACNVAAAYTERQNEAMMFAFLGDVDSGHRRRCPKCGMIFVESDVTIDLNEYMDEYKITAKCSESEYECVGQMSVQMERY